MNEIEVFLTIDISKIQKASSDFHERLVPELEKDFDLTNIQFIINSSELSFQYDLDKRILNNVLSGISKEGYIIDKLFIHLPSAISGISDVYDASSRGQVVKDKIQEIKGINGVGVSSNGVLKLEINALEQDQDRIIDNVLKAVIKDSKNEKDNI